MSVQTFTPHPYLLAVAVVAYLVLYGCLWIDARRSDDV